MLPSVWLLPDSMVSFSPDVDVLAEVLVDRSGFKRGEDVTAPFVTILDELLLWVIDLLAAPLCHVISRLMVPRWIFGCGIILGLVSGCGIILGLVSGCCTILGLVSGCSLILVFGSSFENFFSELHFLHRLDTFGLEHPDEEDVKL